MPDLDKIFGKINLPGTFRVINVAILIYAFLIGGTLQMVAGLSTTGMNLMITGVLALQYVLYVILKRRIIINPPLFFGLALLGYMVALGLANSKDPTNIFLYALMVIMPMMVYYNQKISDRLRFSLSRVKYALLIIALFQVVAVGVQIAGYDFLQDLNRSGQGLLRVDFDYGTLLFKNDHALGLFLICNILFVASHKKYRFINKLLIILILSGTILLLNSKASWVMWGIAIIYLVFRHKLLKPFLIAVGALIILTGAVSLTFTVVEKPTLYKEVESTLESKYSYKSAVKYFELTQARRDQIINIWLHEDINWLGHGPYSYFDIKSGRFSETYVHFSQWLWAYHDLGLVGMALEIAFFISLFGTFGSSSTPYSSLIGVFFLLYGIFTIVAFDLNFLLIYFIYKRHTSLE